jgi:hypothetical protein
VYGRDFGTGSSTTVDPTTIGRRSQLHGFGGVRLEQNVLIGDDGCDVLTAAIPLPPS